MANALFLSGSTTASRSPSPYTNPAPTPYQPNFPTITGQRIQPTPWSPYHYDRDRDRVYGTDSLRTYVPRTEPARNPMFRANSAPGTLPDLQPYSSSHHTVHGNGRSDHPLATTQHAGQAYGRRESHTPRRPASPSPLRRFSVAPTVNQSSSSKKTHGVCHICMAAYYNVLFVPCCHVACCVNCATSLECCLVCGKHITKKLKIYPM